MWYAYTALHDPAQRFISLEVGKQPLFIWLTMFYIQFIGTPLLAGRLVSVTAGLLTMLGVWFLTFRLFNNRSLSYIAAAVFIFSPFAELINRLGNFDSTVGMFYIWSLFFTVLLVQTVRLDVAYTLGLSLAGGILTKSSAFFSLYLLPVAFILFDFTNHHYRRRFITLLILFGVAVLLAYSLYSLLQLSPYYERIAWFNGSFVYPKREWLHLDTGFRLALFRDNLFVLSDYFVYYITLPFLAFIPLALWFGRQHMRVLLLLLAYSFLPLLALAVFGRGIGSRWIYPFTLPLIPVIAHGLHSVIIVLWQRRKIYHPGMRLILVPSLL
jgi:4-amino-4-deoxy-L-arabinose transferase-like glycosyltransferase